ncbi:MAG TPA: hypothetical protein VFI04_01035 [Gaiellaceae bacterium]|nr:hypothetical protein [Gaiellaceae bacterium]
MAEAKTTTDHDEIRRWTESRGGHPAHVTETAADGDLGVLRIDFAEPNDRLEEISWDDWFEAFEENKLAFLYQDEGDSRFNKLVDRANANGNG